MVPVRIVCIAIRRRRLALTEKQPQVTTDSDSLSLRHEVIVVVLLATAVCSEAPRGPTRGNCLHRCSRKVHMACRPKVAAETRHTAFKADLEQPRCIQTIRQRDVAQKLRTYNTTPRDVITVGRTQRSFVRLSRDTISAGHCSAGLRSAPATVRRAGRMHLRTDFWAHLFRS